MLLIGLYALLFFTKVNTSLEFYYCRIRKFIIHSALLLIAHFYFAQYKKYLMGIVTFYVNRKEVFHFLLTCELECIKKVYTYSYMII